MAFTAVAALVSAETVTAGMALAAIGEVGMALTVVGAATGDRNLMQTGSVMGLVGGIGGWAMGGAAGAAGTAVDAGADATAGATADVAAETAAAQAAPAAAATSGEIAGATGSLPASQAADTIGTTATMDGAAQAAPIQATGAAPVTDVAAQAPTAVQSATSPTPEITPEGASYSLTNGSKLPGQGLTSGSAGGGLQTKIGPDEWYSGLGKAWSGLGDRGQAAVVTLAGGAMSGANQRDMFERQMAQREAEMALKSHGNTVPVYRRGIVNSARS